MRRKTKCSRCGDSSRDVHKVVHHKVKVKFPRLCGWCLVIGFREVICAEVPEGS